MSGLLFAGDNDFFLSQNNNGNKMLCTKINGPVLVLFYSTQCQYCKKLIPIFKKLTGMIGQYFFQFSIQLRIREKFLFKNGKFCLVNIINILINILVTTHLLSDKNLIKSI